MTKFEIIKKLQDIIEHRKIRFSGEYRTVTYIASISDDFRKDLEILKGKKIKKNMQITDKFRIDWVEFISQKITGVHNIYLPDIYKMGFSRKIK